MKQLSWSFLLVFLFILKSRLGTTSSLVEYFSRRIGEEGNSFTEADDSASFWRRNVLFVNKVIHTLIWSFLLVLLFILKSHLGTTPSLFEYFSRRIGEEGNSFTEADDFASFWRRNVLFVNKVIHTLIWSFLLVLQFILKSHLGTTPSLFEYFSRRIGEEGNSFTEADDSASFWRRNVLFVNKVIHTLIWSFLLALLFILKSHLGTTPSLFEYFSRRIGDEGNSFTEADDSASFWRRNVLFVNKVIHTLIWSFLLVLLFILKSHLGTTPSLFEYFSRCHGEEVKGINRS